MFDFLFMDIETGEEFFVECESLSDAWEILECNFGDTDSFQYLGKYTVEEAEILGYDTY